MKRLPLAILLAACLCAEDNRVESPALGYVFDAEARAVRRILGIPGASRFSDPLPLVEIERAWIAPGLSYAAIVRAQTAGLERIDLLTGETTAVTADAPEHVVWSARGTAAALFYAGGRIRVFTQMESSPSAGLDVNAAGEVSTIAVSDDGVVLAIRRTGQSATLIAFSESGDERLLLTAPGLNNIAFLNGARDAIVSDAAEGKLYLLRDTTSLSMLAQVENPSAIAVSPDNSRAFVAGKQGITTIGINDGIVKSFDCSCVPDTLRLLRNSVFRISSRSDAPVWLFNSDAAENPFTFVPQPESRLE